MNHSITKSSEILKAIVGIPVKSAAKKGYFSSLKESK
jgi:hypothetical protein